MIDVFKAGQHVVLYGGAEMRGHGGLQLTNPDHELLDDEEGGETIHTGRIVPIYEKAGTVTPKIQRRFVHDALLRITADLPDPVPEALRARQGYPARYAALHATHFPPSDVSVDELNRFATLAQRRLIFEEAFLFQMGVMAAQQEEQPSDDGAFVAEQMQEMEQAKGDEEFVAYQMGVMTEQAKDDAFVQEQLGEMEQQQRDDGFVAEQMGVMAQAQAANANDNNADAAFVEEQLGEMAKQQSDEEFARYQIGLMEAEAKAEGKQPAEAEAPKKATAEAAPEAQLVEHVAKTPDPEPELLGAALAENPELRQPLVEEATKAQGAEVVEQAVEVEQQEQADGGAIAHDEPALTAEVEAKPAVIEDFRAWIRAGAPARVHLHSAICQR